eukprot:12399583-Karenia_brevis.AAC.1
MAEEESLEPYVDWIRRCTHDAEAKLAALEFHDWITMHREIKWNKFGELLRGECQTWSQQAFDWRPLS